MLICKQIPARNNKKHFRISIIIVSPPYYPPFNFIFTYFATKYYTSFSYNLLRIACFNNFAPNGICFSHVVKHRGDKQRLHSIPAYICSLRFLHTCMVLTASCCVASMIEKDCCCVSIMACTVTLHGNKSDTCIHKIL